MSERPFMQLYVSAFLADSAHLSTEEIGAYGLLLAALWNADRVLPNDERKLAKVARMPIHRWREVWPMLEPFFFVDGAGKTTTRHVKKWFSKATVNGRMPLSAAVRSSIFDRDGGCCRYCGVTEGPFHVDHVIPVAKGGSDDPENLVIACKPCNLSKGAKLLEEWQ